MVRVPLLDSDCSRSLFATLGSLLVGVVSVLLPLGLVATASAQTFPVPEDASVEEIATGLQFTEGPLWYEGRLVFSDIPANTVYEWTPERDTSTFLRPSGHANGLAVGPDGHLLLAQHDGQVGRLGQDGSIEPIVDSYQGRRLNSPNDLTVADDGTIYFTDPPYGVSEENRELDFAGVYRVTPDGSLSLLTDSLSRPNGIVLSPDESTLYVNDSEGAVVYAYDVTAEGGIANGRLFAAPEADANGSTDGMKVDANGNLYTTGPGGVWVYSPNGELLDRISVPHPPTNVAFGGSDRKTLYITGRPSVYRIPLTVRGAE